MSDTPTLYGWNPRLDTDDEGGRTITLTLTPLGATNTVLASRSMCVQILDLLSIDALPTQWSCSPFRTSYYSAPDAPPDERWRIVWTMTIKLDRTLTEYSQHGYEYFEVSEGGSYAATPVEATLDLECHVIADFQSADDARDARDRVQQKEPDAKCRIFDLRDQFVQLDINLDRVAAEEFAHRFNRGEHIENTCRESGGITNSTEREDAWDIVSDEGD